MKSKTFDLPFLNECFIANFIDGTLIWKIRPKSHFATENAWAIWNSKFSGKYAGNIDKSSQSETLMYRRITMSSLKSCSVHRILYAMFHEDPVPPVIDHLDGNGLNNSISNLIPSTSVKNAKNKKRGRNNKTGILGVSWNSNGEYWECKIGSVENRDEYKRKLFKDFFEACCQRKAWENEFNYTKRHGSK